ncbi:PP2C family protein-serine/threonine phosphatase [Marinactinospora rubrisoli]|uniref:PP2C family protein-serine/threonine phosphatase n=1 Tax=Marinactinospora rubrisoli TaxID=2715399 RepID=A0ABW2KNA4_9ACTN
MALTEQPRRLAATIGAATDQGPRDQQKDAAAVHTTRDGDVGAVLVDGFSERLGEEPVFRATAELAAWVAAKHDALAGLIAAQEVIHIAGRTAGTDDLLGPDCVGAIVSIRRDGSADATWTGDCRVYTWRRADKQLTLHTRDHTEGARMRERIAAEPELAESWADPADFDHEVTTTMQWASIPEHHHREVPIGRRAIAGWVPLPTCDMVLITCDGVHDTMPHEDLQRVVTGHADQDPAAIAQALITAARAADAQHDDPDERVDDNATAVVVKLAATTTGGI